MKPTGQEMLLWKDSLFQTDPKWRDMPCRVTRKALRDGQVAEGAREKCGSVRGNRQGKVSRLSIGSSERSIWLCGIEAALVFCYLVPR